MKYPKNAKAFFELATEGGETVLLFDKSKLQFHRHLISAIHLPFLPHPKCFDLISIYPPGPMISTEMTGQVSRRMGMISSAVNMMDHKKAGQLNRRTTGSD